MKSSLAGILVAASIALIASAQQHPPTVQQERESDPPVPHRHEHQHLGPIQAPEQIQLLLEQTMTEAGVDTQRAQRTSRRLAREISRDRPEAEEIREKVERALTQAGFGQQRAEEEAEELGERIAYILNPEEEERFLVTPPQQEQEARPQQQQQQGARGQTR